MTEKLDQILDLERKFWTEGPGFYNANVDDACMVAFDPDMAKTMSNADVSATVEENGRWQEVEMDLKATHEPTPDIIFLTYEASAHRDGENYHALVSSAYAQRGDAWKLTFHAQTPLPDKAHTHRREQAM